MQEVGTQLFWDLSRGTGIAAMVLAGLSVTTGLLASRARPVRLKKLTEKKELHEALSMATIVAVIAHAVLLLFDPWLNAGVSGIAVPFVLDYRPFFTGIGIIAGYGLIVLGLSYYVRTWIGVNRWRAAHRFTSAFWVLGLVHTFGAGTDADQLWLLIPVFITSAPAFVLLAMRLFGSSHRGSTPKKPAEPAPSS